MLLKEFLGPLGVSQIEAARRIEVPFQRLNAIINGRRALQSKWDLGHARRAWRGRPTVKRLRITRARV
jgi:plasmid maintenance system antidote protein VapI